MQDKEREYHRAYRQKNKERIRAVAREKIQRNRRKVIEKLGGKCVYCGCDIPEALEVNHINGVEGVDPRHRTTTTSGIYAILRGEYDGQLELTCGVCNKVHYFEKLLKLNGKWTVSFSCG